MSTNCVLLRCRVKQTYHNVKLALVILFALHDSESYSIISTICRQRFQTRVIEVHDQDYIYPG